jgi:hypothetical protein
MEIVSQVTGDNQADFIDQYVPEQLQPLAYEYLDDTGLLPPEVQEEYNKRSTDQDPDEEGGMPKWVLPVAIGGGALAIYMLSKKKPKSKKRR